jgi:hypothetical protein
MLPGLCKLGFASDSANPFSAASPVLGCVPMGFYSHERKYLAGIAW